MKSWLLYGDGVDPKARVSLCGGCGGIALMALCTFWRYRVSVV